MCLVCNEQTKVRGYLRILLYKIMVYLETLLGFDTFVRRSTNKIHVVKNHIKNKIKPLHQEIRNGRKLNKIKKQKKHLP